MMERFFGRIKMFQHIEQENEIVMLFRLKTGIEWSNCDPGTVSVPRVNKVRIGFNALNISKLSQPFKEECVAAPNIENREIRFPGHAFKEFVKEDVLPGSPPPVILVQLAIMSAIVRVQAHLPGGICNRAFAQHLGPRGEAFPCNAVSEFNWSLLPMKRSMT